MPSEPESHRNARRVRISVAGEKLFLGRAPTPEAAQTLLTKIKKEAPNGRTVRNA